MTEPTMRQCCEPGRWVPLVLFILVVVLSVDYNSLLLV